MIVEYAFTTLLYCLAVAIIDDPNGARENSNVQQFGDYVNYDTDDDTLNTPDFDYNFWVANDYELYHELISYYKSRGHDCPCDYDNETFTADCALKELIYKVPDCVPNVTRILNLEDNKLHYRPGFFDRFIDLRELNLRWNEFLESFREVKITGFPKLRRLDLSFCSIYYLDASRFIGLVNLRTLVLEGNYISTISKDSLSETPKLTHLDLSYNVITSIDSYTFSELPNLTNLDLSYNPDPYQSELPFSFTRNSFAGLSTLKNLSLEGVHVANSSSFPVDLFRPLRTLEELNLFRFCRYRQIGDYNYCLNLHKHLSNLPLLRRLNLDVDWLIHLGPGFKSLANLQEISFLVASDVEFESISNKTFENLRVSPLSMMSLISDSENPSDVAINNVMPYTFASLTHLQELDFSFVSDNCNTAFENFAIGLDKTLIRRLRFSIQCYSDDVLYSGINLAKDILNTQLEYLDLSNGPIAFMDNWIMEMHNYMMGRGDFFSNLPKSLKYLYLQYNHLRRVDFKNLQTLGELLVLNMSCDPNHHNLRQLRHKRNADGTDQSHSGAYSTDQSQSGAYGTDQSQSRTDSTDQSRSRTDSKDQSQSGTDTIEMEQPMDLATDTSDKDAENNENELLQSEDKC